MKANSLVPWSIVARSHIVAGARATRALVEKLDRHDVLSAASAMAFDVFLSLIPILAMAGYVLHRLRQSGSAVIGPLIRTAPTQIQELASVEFLRLSETGAAALAPISVIGFLWVSSAGLSTAMSHCELMFQARPRHWIKRRAIATVCVVAGLFAIGAVAASAVLVGRVFGPAGATVVGVALPGAVLLGGLWAFYRISIQRRPDVKRRAFPGAIVTLFLWTGLTYGFSEYVRDFAAYATFYGSLAAVAIMLLWLWLLMLALLMGAEVNAALEGARSVGPMGQTITASLDAPRETASQPESRPVALSTAQKIPIASENNPALAERTPRAARPSPKRSPT